MNQNGYAATGCLNASDAYNAMYETMFDLIISDIMMPEIDGYEFAKTVRSLNAEIPILFMAARDDILSMQKSYRIGIDDYISHFRRICPPCHARSLCRHGVERNRQGRGHSGEPVTPLSM